MNRFEGRTALVAGAASGIGRAIAVRLAAEGARVFCADIDLAGAHETAQSVGGTGVFLDVTDDDAWRQIVASMPTLDLLIYAAGISHTVPVWETSLADWRRVMAVNLDGAMLALRHAIPVMRAHGHESVIVAVSSPLGSRAEPGASAYCASKAALTILCRTAALECARNGDSIRIATVAPPQEADAESVAATIAFLASPEASLLTATELIVDGA